jgi:hypothetical protein
VKTELRKIYAEGSPFKVTPHVEYFKKMHTYKLTANGRWLAKIFVPEGGEATISINYREQKKPGNENIITEFIAQKINLLKENPKYKDQVKEGMKTISQARNILWSAA